jgi:hypothetical protein
MELSISWEAANCAERLGALEVDPSMWLVRLFTIEVNLDQALGSWYYYFTKLIHRIKNLVTVK